MHEYIANLHVHTTYSDGSGDIAAVIAAAQKAGLDLLLINDHDTLAAREQGYEGYHDRLLVLVGLEISGRHNHYLAYNIDHCPPYNWRRPQDFINQVKQQGGLGFIAHPFEKGSPLSEGGRSFNWVDWTVSGFNGLCLWNHTSAWKTKAKNLRRALFHYFFNTGTLSGPEPEALAKWDELGQTRKVPGLGESDVHAFKAKLLGLFNFCVFPYDTAFRAVNTHLLLPVPLTGQLGRDKAKVYQALAQGSCFVAHDRLHPGRGFDFWLERNNEKRAGQGEEVKWMPGDRLTWLLPDTAKIRLIKNGRIIMENKGLSGNHQPDSPGVYRLEADWTTRLFGPRPWIFSNPVYLR